MDMSETRVMNEVDRRIRIGNHKPYLLAWRVSNSSKPFQPDEVGCISRAPVDPSSNVRSRAHFDFLGLKFGAAPQIASKKNRNQIQQLPEKGNHFVTGKLILLLFQKQPTLGGGSCPTSLTRTVCLLGRTVLNMNQADQNSLYLYVPNYPAR